MSVRLIHYSDHIMSLLHQKDFLLLDLTLNNQPNYKKHSHQLIHEPALSYTAAEKQTFSIYV